MNLTASALSVSAPAAAPAIDVVQVTKAVGDALRANILKALAEDSFGVLELGDIFAMAQPAISHHLKKLREAGLVNQRREGTSVFYQRTPPAHAPLLAAIFDALDAAPLANEFQRGIARVHEARLSRSKSFFNDQADALAQQTALICAPEVYVQAVLQTALAQPTLERGAALEVGPGSGSLLQALAPHFQRVVGVDNSAEVLTRTQASTTHLDNVELVETDFASLPKAPTYDLVVAAMVVHHMPSPLGFFQHAARLLNNGGLLVLAELCRHDQDWVQDLCGDLWLGFFPEELVTWSEQAGLTQFQQQFLAQRNGFRVLVSGFMRRADTSQTSTNNPTGTTL